MEIDFFPSIKPKENLFIFLKNLLLALGSGIFHPLLLMEYTPRALIFS